MHWVPASRGDVPVAAARAEHAWLAGNTRTVIQEVRSALEYALRDHNQWRLGELVFWSWRVGAPVEGALTVATPVQLQMSGDSLGSAREWAALGCPYEEALALADCPDAELRKQALEIFDGLGARPMARDREQLKAEGVRDSSAARTARPEPTWPD